MQFLENNTIQLDKVGKTKKLTATRFATIFGLNAWNTPFSAWCEITKTYEPPFEESKYTLAGKLIEGKVINYLKKRYFLSIKNPTEVYGADYFKKTWGDFFHEQKVLGGMWDALGTDFIVEIKTTQRAEDWENDAPIYYKLQAGLYAYLCGFDKFIMTCSFLKESDYPVQRVDGTWDTTQTEKFEPSIKNTKTYEFSLNKEFPNFKENYIDPALRWWIDYVEAGVSPQFDEKKDAEILKVLRKNTLAPTDDEITKLIAESEKINSELNDLYIKTKPLEDKKKEVEEQIKKYMQDKFRDGDKNVEIKGKSFVFTLTKKNGSTTIDKTALKKDGLLDKYSKVGSPTYALSLKEIEAKEEK